MFNKKSKEAAVKALKYLFDVEDAKTEKFEDVKGTDSRIFRVSGLGVDQTIMEVTEAGVVPVTETEVTLEDGSILEVADNLITKVTEGEPSEDSTEEPAAEEMSKLKLFSKVERANFAIIKEISVWETEVDNTSFELGEKVTYTYEEVQYGVCDGQYELEDGTKIFIDTESIIVMRILPDGTVEAPESAAQPASEEAPADSTSEEMSAEDKIISEGFVKMIESFTSLQEEIKSLKEDNKKLAERVDKFSKEPSANPTNTTVKFSNENTPEEKSVLHSILKNKRN